MQGLDPFTLTLELARADTAGRADEFVFAPQGYLLRSAGGNYKNATFPWNDTLLSDLNEIRRLDHDPAVVQRLGGLLRAFLEHTQWPVLEAKVREAVEKGCPVVITIRLAAAELYALPWELLTIEATGQHLGELPGVLVRYEWPETTTVPQLHVGRGRILFAWSGHVPASEHQASIIKACGVRAGSGSYPFDVERFDLEQDVLPDVSCSRLSEKLQSATHEGRPITILHLLCHGTAAGSTFGLALDGDEPDEGVVAVDAGRLRQILAPHARTLRLVVLAACDSGNVGVLGNQMGSIAQALHRAGIAGVVASRFPVSTSGSNRLAKAFYGSLLGSGSSLEQAFLAARAHLAEDARQLDWASLQLYGRADDDNVTAISGTVSINVLRDPEVREQLSSYHALFTAKREQISRLVQYKDLHDALQELETPFNVVVREKRLVAPEAWDELRTSLEDLLIGVNKVRGIMAEGLLKGEFDVSQRRLADATALLGAAMAGEQKKLDDALFYIQHGLNLDTSSANTRLVSTARELNLGSIVTALRSVYENLRQSRVVGASVNEWGRLVGSLDKLHTTLEALVSEHNKWQGIDNELRHLVDPKTELHDTLLVWPQVRVSLEEVCSGANADWSRDIDAAAKDLDDTLARGDDPRKRLTCSRNLFRYSNRRFVDVNKELKHTCEDLRQVGDTLDSVLKMQGDR